MPNYSLYQLGKELEYRKPTLLMTAPSVSGYLMPTSYEGSPSHPLPVSYVKMAPPKEQPSPINPFTSKDTLIRAHVREEQWVQLYPLFLRKNSLIASTILMKWQKCFLFGKCLEI